MLIRSVIAAAFVGVGGYLAYSGGRGLFGVYHILRNDPVPVRELQGRSGPVEVEGTARPGDDSGTVTAPFTGTECLAYEYEVEELRSSGKNSHWRTLDEGADGVAFEVADDTGRVRVDLEGADVRLEDRTTRVSPGDELPAELTAYVESTDDVETQDTTVDLLVTELNVGNEQRFTERRLDVGESVYVYGQARTSPSTEWGSARVDVVVGDGEAAPVFVISDTGERETAWRFAGGGLVRLLAGLLVVGLPVLLIAGGGLP